MSFAQTILDTGNYITVPRPLVKYMGINTTIFFIWMMGHQATVKKKARNPKEFYFDAGTIEKQTGLSLYQQNRIIEKLTKLKLLKVTGRDRHNRKRLTINHKRSDQLIINLYSEWDSSKETKEESYKETLRNKRSLMKKLNKSINKKKHINKKKQNNKLLSAKDRKSLCSTDKPSFDKRMSIKLENLLKEKRKFSTRTKPKSWPAQFLEFRRKNEITKKRFFEVMKFYCKHFSDKFVPKAYFANMFCDKFIQIEEAKERLKKDIANGKPRTVKRKKVGSKIIYGDNPQMLYEDFVH